MITSRSVGWYGCRPDTKDHNDYRFALAAIGALPAAARRYVERIGALLEVPIDLVSVGREREQLAR